MLNLNGKLALVTGAGTGLGQGIALKLAEAGARVALTGLSLDDLRETSRLCKAHGAETLTVQIDVRDVDQIFRGVDEITSRAGPIHILVNNAGINRPTPALEVDPANWEDHFRTNVRGGYFCAKAVAPGMIERKSGRIIFISSQSGLVGIPGQTVYCSSKGAIVNLVRSLGVEWARHGITVNSVAPTFVETNLTRKRLQEPKFREFVLGKIPKGQLATAADVASAVVYLASDEASMINCVNLPVDGGWTAW